MFVTSSECAVFSVTEDCLIRTEVQTSLSHSGSKIHISDFISFKLPGSCKQLL